VEKEGITTLMRGRIPFLRKLPILIVFPIRLIIFPTRHIIFPTTLIIFLPTDFISLTAQEVILVGGIAVSKPYEILA
jgi:hypothetical protein